MADPVWVEPWTRSQGEIRARSLMGAAWGEDADGVWSAPGRVTIVGEHTDYSGGQTLPTVTPHRTYVAARRRDDDRVRVASGAGPVLDGPGPTWEGDLESIGPETAAGWPAYVVGVLWSLRERGFDGPGMDVAIESCVPVSTGLAASAAVECATALAANDLWRLALDDDAGHAELAAACLDAETTLVGVPAGGLDQHTLLRCREGEAVELDFASHPPAAMHCPLYFPDYGLALLITDTTVPHDVSGGGYRQQRRDCEEVARMLGVPHLRALADEPGGLKRLDELGDERLRRRARHVLTEIERVRTVSAELAGTGPAHERFVTVGKELYRSHASLEVDFELSSPELNCAVDAAFAAGALGARLMGGGVGGSTMALVRRTHAEPTARHIATALTDRGFPAPQFLLI